MDAEATLPSVPLSRELQLLIVVLAFWEIAAIRRPQHTLRYIKPGSEYDDEIINDHHCPLWVFEQNRKLDASVHYQMPEGFERLRTQFALTNTCDMFCALFEDLIARKIEHKFGSKLTVRWIQCCTRPISQFVKGWVDFAADLKTPTWHSVLEITWSNGGISIFDGTIEQFGHKLSENWLLSKDKYEEDIKSSTPDWAMPYQLIKENVEAKVFNGEFCSGYWTEVRDFAEQFFEDFDWQTIHGMSALKTKEPATRDAEALLADL
ncbi:hypothetical protein CC86DRAFT_468344 [Ophiobolus disseminans]|uniref:Uncharacterized protein n=1 Tax=Ophiobolus disseminans TaxID=1469910 RepID=A0A6A6ZV05_9PLEO|nr:hypothetical protein CC86DRAFT_468344 [Ophiobolus disseminans]